MTAYFPWIHPGSVYCDPTLRQFGFNGEGLVSGSVLAVKTHNPVPRWIDPDNRFVEAMVRLGINALQL